MNTFMNEKLALVLCVLTDLLFLGGEGIGVTKVQTSAPPIQNTSSIVTACAATAVLTAVLFAIVCVTYQTRSSLRKTCKRINIHTNNESIFKNNLLIHWLWLKMNLTTISFNSTLRLFITSKQQSPRQWYSLGSYDNPTHNDAEHRRGQIKWVCIKSCEVQLYYRHNMAWLQPVQCCLQLIFIHHVAKHHL